MSKEKTIGSKLLKNVYVKNIGLMLIIAAVLLGLVLMGLNVYTNHGSFVVVPSLKGMQVEEAGRMLETSGLKYEVVDSVFKKGGKPGSILEQTPKDSSRVKEGRTIYLTVQARGEEMISVPDVVDTSLRQAEALLSALGFENISIREVEGEFESLVLGVESRGLTVKPGQKIPKSAPLVLSVGKGMSIEEDSLFLFEGMGGNEEIIDEVFE